jgi:ferritin-like metal-binding protein YciE
MNLNSITDVMGDQLGDLRSAERQLLDALPKMTEAATDSDLKTAFSNHYEQTKSHFSRLQRSSNRWTSASRPKSAKR